MSSPCIIITSSVIWKIQNNQNICGDTVNHEPCCQLRLQHKQIHTHTHVCKYTHTHAYVDWGAGVLLLEGKSGRCEGRDGGDKCPRGPWGYPNGVIHQPSQSHAEQSCQCMNAALLLSAVLIMAPVTALINTITSHWKSLRGELWPGERAQRHGECVHGAAAVRKAERVPTDGWMDGRTGGQPDGRTHCCDFVVHHCPC